MHSSIVSPKKMSLHFPQNMDTHTPKHHIQPTLNTYTKLFVKLASHNTNIHTYSHTKHTDHQTSKKHVAICHKKTLKKPHFKKQKQTFKKCTNTSTNHISFFAYIFNFFLSVYKPLPMDLAFQLMQWLKL